MPFMIFVGLPAKAVPVRSYRGSTRPIPRPAGASAEAVLRDAQETLGSADRRIPSNLKRLAEEGLGIADGLMEMRGLVVRIQSGHAGPFLDQKEYFRIARVLQNLVADAAGFLARLCRELENDCRDLSNRFGSCHDFDHDSHPIAHGHLLTKKNSGEFACPANPASNAQLLAYFAQFCRKILYRRFLRLPDPQRPCIRVDEGMWVPRLARGQFLRTFQHSAAWIGPPKPTMNLQVHVNALNLGHA